MSKYKDDPTDYWRLSSDFCVVDNRVVHKIGLNEAIVLRTLYNLCRTKKQNDGISWWQGKQKYWLLKFPWLSENRLRGIFSNLEKMQLIEIRIDRKTGNHYRLVHEQIQGMLNNESFQSYQNGGKDTDSSPENCGTDILLSHENSGTETLPSHENRGVSHENRGMSHENRGTLLTLGSHMHSQMHSQDIATADAAASVKAIQPEVLPAVIETPKAKNARKSIKVKTSSIQPHDEAQKACRGKGEPSPITVAWRAYSEAFEGLYRVKPICNAKVMGQVRNFIQRVGKDAPDILRFFLTMPDRWFLQQQHSLDVALKNAEKIANAFRGAVTLTEKEARLIDEQRTTQNQIDREYEEFYRQEAMKNARQEDN